MMLATPMMTVTPNDVCLTAHWANIASLRNEVEQHHFEQSEKHHIAAGDASLDNIQGFALILKPSIYTFFHILLSIFTDSKLLNKQVTSLLSY